MIASTALHDIRTRGAAVIRGAFDPTAVAGLLDNVASHADAVVSGQTQFPDFYRWTGLNLTCDLTALDPATRETHSSDFNATTLHRAILSDAMQAILRDRLGPDAGYGLVRARTIVPMAESRKTGALALHMEKTAIPFPGVHVIWTPLTPPGVVVNRDAPGLLLHLDGGEIIRPEMEVGDVIVFTGDVPHSTHIPDNATHWRVGCDIRIFPWTETSFLPPTAVRDGQRHARLNLSR